jgi:hypothetical protein
MYPSRIIAIKSFRNTRLTMKKKLRKYTYEKAESPQPTVTEPFAT